MRINGFVSIEEAEKKKGFLEALKGEVKIIDDKWVLDEDTGTIVKKRDYYIPGFVVGVDPGEEEASLSNIEHLTPPPEGQGGATNPGYNPLDPIIFTEIGLWNEARNHKCGVFVQSKCNHCGTRVISRVPCKREWCEYCGREQSYFHLIYYYKILRYAVIIFTKNGGRLGYLVVTTTPELWQQFLEDPKKMHKFREDVKEKLKELGYEYGLWRWHFAGDRGQRFYPHLNILLPEGYMPEEKLVKFKRWIEKKYGVKVVNYEWTEDLGKVKHWARYIARPTWNLQNEADPEKFKGMRKFGVWGNKHFKMGDIQLTEGEVFFLALMIVADELELRKAIRELNEGKIERDLTLILHLIRRNRCVKCGAKVKWDFVGFSDFGVLQGLRDGEFHRIGWNTWVYVPRGGPPPDDDNDDEIVED